MKTYLKNMVRKGISKLVGIEDLPKLLQDLRRLSDAFDMVHTRLLFNQIASTNQGIQRLLYHTYRQLGPKRSQPHSFWDAGLRCFSQSDEDGLLLYIFSLVGTTNKRVVEICAGDGIECNASNLIINHGWSGLLFDGDDKNIATGRRFYARCRDTCSQPPTFVHAWITADNVNSLISGHHF